MATRGQRRRVAPERAAAFAAAVKDNEKLAQLYAEVAEEDRARANAGLTEYARGLADIDNEE